VVVADVSMPAALFKLATKLTEYGISEQEKIQVISSAKVGRTGGGRRE
jgi:hypothetical protein